MIKYQLKCKSRFCANEKEFDGWFQSIETYENQKLQKLINCPICGSDKVVKSLTAPNLKINKIFTISKTNFKNYVFLIPKNIRNIFFFN